MAPRPPTPPTGDFDDFARMIDQLLLGLDDAMKKRGEALNRPQVKSGHVVDESSRQFRAQAVQSVRSAIKDLSAEDVAIVYDNGQSVETMDKDFLCGTSRYFEKAFKGPFMEASTRIIRLRHDFPWAVYAMLDFLKNGCYYLYPLLQKQYPRITMLDFHVHAYIIADKYDIPALSDCAAKSYLRMAADCLVLDWQFDDPDFYDGSNLPCVEYLPWDMCAAAEVSRFLDSTVLLWKNTASRRDSLRREVLEMLKACFIKLMRLKSFQFLLVRLEDFLDDLIESFEEDGLEVRWMMRKVTEHRVTFIM